MTETHIIPDTNRVSVKLMAGEEAEAVAEAVMETQSHARVEDHRAYLAIEAPDELEIDVDRVSECLGRPYDVPTLLVILSSYVGRIDVQDRKIRISNAITQN
jgi:hypothetical protein